MKYIFDRHQKTLKYQFLFSLSKDGLFYSYSCLLQSLAWQMQSNQQVLYWGTQQLMLGPKISYQEAKQEPIFLTMALIFLTLDPLEGSVINGFNSADFLDQYTSSTSKLFVEIQYLSLNQATCFKLNLNQWHYSIKVDIAIKVDS